MSTLISTLIPRIAFKVPGAADLIIDEAIRTAAIEFCRESKVVTQNAPDVSVIALQASNVVYSNDTVNLDVVGVREAWWSGTKIWPTTVEDITRREGHNYWPTTPGTPLEYYMDAEDTVVLYRTPEVAGTLSTRIAVAPTRTTELLPDQLMKQWREAISAGALAWLYSVEGSGWASPDNAAKYAGVYGDYLDKAKSEAARNFGRVKLRARGHFF
jgi:hypothetical protein